VFLKAENNFCRFLLDLGTLAFPATRGSSLMKQGIRVTPVPHLTVAVGLPGAGGQGDNAACFGKGLPKAFPCLTGGSRPQHLLACKISVFEE